MGMGMVEGEWAAKRGPTRSTLRQGSLLGGRQGTSDKARKKAGGLYPLRLFLPAEFLSIPSSSSRCLDVFKHLVLVFSFGL